jgi:phosphopentomutase
VNLVDFDMLYGHRNDAPGYARALEELDRALPPILARLRPGDVLAVTADHGCDPTTPSTDHSREYVPLLVHSPGRGGGSLGVRSTFADLGASVAELFGLRPETGTSFLSEIGHAPGASGTTSA